MKKTKNETLTFHKMPEEMKNIIDLLQPKNEKPFLELHYERVFDPQHKVSNKGEKIIMNEITIIVLNGEVSKVIAKDARVCVIYEGDHSEEFIADEPETLKEE